MTTENKTHLKGALLSIAGFSLYAMGDAAFKYLGAYYSPANMMFYVSLFVVILLLAASPWLGGIKPTFQSKNIKLHLLRGVFIFCQAFLFVWSLQHLSMAKAYSIAFIAPFMTTLLSIPLLKENVKKRQWLAIGAGFVGILVILRPGFIPLEPATFALIGAALFFSLANLTVRYLRHENETMLAWGLLPQITICTLAIIASLHNFIVPDPAHLGYLLFIGITSGAGIICLSLSFVNAPASIAAPFQYVQILWAILLGYLIFGDVLDIWTAIGVSVIILSGIWLIRNTKENG